MSSPLIQLQNTVFGHADKPLVGPINLTIEPGDHVLLEGPSGCGKTSLLRGLLGFLQARNGRYQLHGDDATPSAIWQFRQTTGYITQELHLGSGLVRDWVQEVLPPERELHEADLMRFQLSHTVLEQALDELSRGERQRLALVAMLAREPAVLLLDEVTSALNDSLRQLVIAQIARSTATVIVISHDDAWRQSEAFQPYFLPIPS